MTEIAKVEPPASCLASRTTSLVVGRVLELCSPEGFRSAELGWTRGREMSCTSPMSLAFHRYSGSGHCKGCGVMHISSYSCGASEAWEVRMRGAELVKR